MKHQKEKHINLRQMKYVKVTDKITIEVPVCVDDDEARETFLLKMGEADRRRQKSEFRRERVKS